MQGNDILTDDAKIAQSDSFLVTLQTLNIERDESFNLPLSYKINKPFERAFQLIYGDSQSTFEQLLNKYNLLSTR